MRVEEYLQKLSDMHAPTGDEEEVAAYLSSEFKKNGFSVSRDALGNVIARKGKGRRIMLSAHMDEIGLAVVGIHKDGFLRFTKVGGIYDAILFGARVIVHSRKGPLIGTIGAKAIHLMKEEERKKLPEVDSMYVDVGASSKEEAEKMGIKPGTMMTLDSKFAKMPNDLLLGKALDNRLGCAILLSIAEKSDSFKEVELCLVGTVREEVGLMGAKVASFALEPELGIAIDSNLSSGAPDSNEERVPIRLGNGPVVGIMNASGRGGITPKKIVSWIEQVAEKNKIALQYEVSEGSSDESFAMQMNKAGALTASLGVPSRYIHSANEVISKKDLDSTLKLVEELVKNFPSYK